MVRSKYNYTWIESVSCSSAGSFREDDVDEEADDVCFPLAVPFTTSRNLFKRKSKQMNIGSRQKHEFSTLLGLAKNFEFRQLES